MVIFPYFLLIIIHALAVFQDSGFALVLHYVQNVPHEDMSPVESGLK
jgi:hypothetical protein